MELEWTREGIVLNSRTFGKNRQIWQATGEDRAYGGGFSILQTEDSPDKLVIQVAEEYGQEISRRDAERLIRNLQKWLDVGDATCPHDENASVCTVPEGHDDEELDRMALELIGKAAEESDVEKVVLRIDKSYEGKIGWSIFVFWGRETVYTDMMHFLDGCGWARDYTDIYFSEEESAIPNFGKSVFETVYEKQGAEESA